MDEKTYSVTHIFPNPEPPHIAVLKNQNGYTLAYLVEETKLSDLNINDSISFEFQEPHKGYNSVLNVSSNKDLVLGVFAINLSSEEVIKNHLPSFRS